MLSYTMDIEERSSWLRRTPSPSERKLPFYCTEVGAFYARERFTTERSNKESFIVFYTLGGAGVIRQGGQEVMLEKGQALLMDCRQPQSYGTSPSRRHWYHLWAHIDGLGVASFGSQLGLPALRPIDVPLSSVRPCFDCLFENLSDEGRTQVIRVSLGVHQLLAEMVLATESAIPSREQNAVEVAQGFLESNYSRKVTVEEAAAAASVSTSQLIRLFRQQLETTPHNYLLRYRITRAKELLAESQMPISSIAERVGFSSDSNFSYRFSQMVGQSPSAYRASAPKLFE